ncbi:hypothetical protein HNR31_003115 [Anoxybacillus caldiproteolyticus]|uniref:Uncharacterized protein n=1 Tax=Thermaerobacillus caldiproteolyticus TaxID=247480 RepID=A0A7V9Z934_9BACL|nr:hypothetical protein [Anoxybacillus caldiproteolyticus]
MIKKEGKSGSEKYIIELPKCGGRMVKQRYKLPAMMVNVEVIDLTAITTLNVQDGQYKKRLWTYTKVHSSFI